MLIAALPIACTSPPPVAALPIACASPPPVAALPIASTSPPPAVAPRSPPAPEALPLAASVSASTSPSPPVEPPCTSDADCGYDPARDRCLADPRANRQPPLVDQGLVCYCDGARCATLRVPPVPCESDASCAVLADPRPHPIPADAAHPHEPAPSRARERARPCRDFVFSTTCERTNICTMHRLACPRP